MSETQEFPTLRCERTGAIATVTLNRPKALNALNAAMFDDLERVFHELAADVSVRVILITGSGDRAFAAGADITELVATDSVSGRAVSERGQQVFSQIESCGKPVIACVNGFAFGGGCELALACTLRIASEKAVFGLPEVKLGLIPGYGGTQRMTRLIGRGQALKLMLTAQNVAAADALRLGLVEEIVPVEELMPRAQAIAQTITGMAPLAIAGILEAAERGGSKPLAEGLLDETDIFARLSGTDDKHEGLTAFLEKRPAIWKGR